MVCDFTGNGNVAFAFKATVNFPLVGNRSRQPVQSIKQVCIKLKREQRSRNLARKLDSFIYQVRYLISFFSNTWIKLVGLNGHRLRQKTRPNQMLAKAVVQLPAESLPFLLGHDGNFLFQASAR